jgi:hypothetical protein
MYMNFLPETELLYDILKKNPDFNSGRMEFT